MTNRDQSRAWLKANIGGRSDWAHDRDVDSLATLLDEVRASAIAEAAEVCDREANACMSHARAFHATTPKKKMAISLAHEMAAGQSKACGAYVRQLAEQ